MDPMMISRQMESSSLRAETATNERSTFEDFLTRIGLSERSKLTLTDFQKIITSQPASDRNFLKDIALRWLRKISEHDRIASHLLWEDLDKNGMEASNGERLSARDIVFAIWKCCDPLLLQEIMRRSVACKSPVPVLSPEYNENAITFHLWGMRKCTTLANEIDKTSFEEINITTHPFVNISALRFGDISISRCDILNKLLAVLSGEDERYFISRINDTASSLWSNGTVEGIWFSSFKDEKFQNALGLFVLRGNSFRYKAQAEFCGRISNVLLIFTNYENAKEAVEIVKKISTSSKVIFVLFRSNRGTRYEMREASFRLINVTHNSPSYVSQYIYHALSEILCDRPVIPSNSLEDSLELCNTMNIIVDELQTKCLLAKEQAKTVVKRVKEANEFGKEVFQLQKLSQEWKAPDDEILQKLGSETDGLSVLGIACESFKKRLCSTHLTETMTTFLNAMVSSDRAHFLSWLEFFLNQEFKDPQRAPERNQTKIDTYQRTNSKRLCTQHFFREIELMCECSHPELRNIEHVLQKITAELVLKGFPFEIIHDDTTLLSTKWVDCVLNELDALLQNKGRIWTVSIVGRSRSSNTYLLNQLFGVNFTGDEKYSNGLQVKLVEGNFTQGLTGKGFLFIAECDTFSPCSDSVSSFLKSAVFCLSDLVIFNIDEEEEMEDIDNICKLGVSTLLRADKIRKLFPSHFTTNTFPVCCAIKHCKGSQEHPNEIYSQLFLTKLRDAAENIDSLQLADENEKPPELQTKIINAFCHKQRYAKYDKDIYCFTLRESPNNFHPSMQYLSDLANFRLHVVGLLTNLCPLKLTDFIDCIKAIKNEEIVMRSYNKLRLKIHNNFYLRQFLMDCTARDSPTESDIMVDQTELNKILNDVQNEHNNIEANLIKEIGIRPEFAWKHFLILTQGEKRDYPHSVIIDSLNISEETKIQLKELLKGSNGEFHSEVSQCLYHALSEILFESPIIPSNSLHDNLRISSKFNITDHEIQTKRSRAKEQAKLVVKAVKDAIDIGQEVFVLQKLSQEWQTPDIEILKKLGSETDGLSVLGTACESFEQRLCSTHLTKTMATFLNAMVSSDSGYFLSWLEFFLNQEYEDFQGSIERSQTRTDTHQRTNSKRLCTQHFFREIELMCECSHQELRNIEHVLPKITAKLVLKGLPFEIIHDDMTFLSTKWVDCVLYELDALLQNKERVLTVSVVGRSRSSNTYLLNQLFGVNFTGDEKCSNGLQVKLVEGNFTQRLTGKGFLFIAESDIFIPCSDSVSSFLQSAVFCLSDLVIFNIDEEEKIEDIDDICKLGVSTLLRADKIRKLFPSHFTTKTFPACCAIKHCKGSQGHSNEVYSQLFLSKLRDATENIDSLQLADKNETRELQIKIINAFSQKQRNAKCGEDNYCFTLRESKNKFYPTKQFLSDLRNFRRYVVGLLANLSPLKLTVFSNCIKAIKKEEMAMRLFYRLRQKIQDDLYHTLCLRNCKRMKTSIGGDIMMDHSKLQTILNYFELKYNNVKANLIKEIGKRPEFAPKHFLALTQGAKRDFPSSMIIESLKISQETKNQLHITNELLMSGEGEFHSEDSYQNLLTSLIIACDKHNYPDIRKAQQMTASRLFYRLKGILVKNFFPELTISSYSVLPTQVKSKADIYEYSTKLFEGTELVKNRIEMLDQTLRVMSWNHENFKENTTKVTKEISKFVSNITNITSMEPGSVYILLFSKYLFDTNRSQLDSEVHRTSQRDKPLDATVTADSEDIAQKLNSSTGKPTPKMTLAEQQKFPDLKAKIKHIRENLTEDIPSDERLILEEFLTVEDVRKYSGVPLNVLTFQIIDRYLFRLLPRLTENEVKVISCLIRDVKLMVIGKTLKMKSLDCEELFDAILETTTKAPIFQHNPNRQRAAVLSHLMAWASYLIAAKKVEENMEEFIEIALEPNANTIALLLQNQIKIKSYDPVVKGLCNLFRRTLIKNIEHGILSKLMEYMENEKHLQRKLNFIGMALRSLLNDSDWLGFIKFLKNFNTFSKNWILTFLAKECNKESNSIIEKLLKTTVNLEVGKAIDIVENVLLKAEQIVVYDFRSWLKTLQEQLVEQCKTYCNKNDFAFLEGITSFEEGVCVLQKFIHQLKLLKEEIGKYFELPPKGNEDLTKVWLLRLPGDMHKDLFEAVKGCHKQCPFCGSVCTHERWHNGNHDVAEHAPTGLKGHNFDFYKELQNEVCNKLVGKEVKRYRFHGTLNELTSFKNDFPEWNIDVNSNLDPSQFWKYVFVHFNKQFADFFGREEGFPDIWQDVSKGEALQSLKDVYKLEGV